MRAARLPIVLIGAVGLLVIQEAAALNPEQLDPQDTAILHATLQRLESLIATKKQDGTASLLTWEALYEPLAPEERKLIDEFRSIKAETLGSTSHYFGGRHTAPDIVALQPAQIIKNGSPTSLDPQHLPRHVYQAYQAMMDAMANDIGKRLLVESGYRSPAYQLYLFLFYLPKHAYSIRETNRHVALPGYSEHGYPPRQAIDLINEEGINGEDHPEEFEALPEYQWLTTHAHRFGFYLSYPRDNPYHTAFEPWHWHYEAPADVPSE